MKISNDFFHHECSENDLPKGIKSDSEQIKIIFDDNILSQTVSSEEARFIKVYLGDILSEVTDGFSEKE